MDHNRATRWSTLDPARGGEWWAVRFDRPVPLDGFSFDLVHVDSSDLKVRVSLTALAGGTLEACASAEPQPLPLQLHRKGAAAFLKAQGIHWIAGRTSGGGHSRIVSALVAAPDLFGLRIAERVDDLVLLSVQ
jgi:hypothetical protein